MLGGQLEVLPPRLEIAFVRRRRRGVGQRGLGRRAALIRIGVAGRHGGRRRADDRRRNRGSAAAGNGRMDSQRPRLGHTDRAQRAVRVPKESERKGRKRARATPSSWAPNRDPGNEWRWSLGGQRNRRRPQRRRRRERRRRRKRSPAECVTLCLVSGAAQTRCFAGKRAGGRASRRSKGEVAARCPDRSLET